jgi:hypothetical protein
MVAFQLVCTVWLWSQPAVSFTQPTMKTRSAATSLRSGATGELKDYAGAAGGLFGTYRIPASLFAGASAGAAFAMPIVAGELATLGYVKRIYAALMISSLVCQLQVIVVSTVALERLSRPYDQETSVENFMRRYFDLEWIAVRLNFFVGVLSFVGTSVCEYGEIISFASRAGHRHRSAGMANHRLSRSSQNHALHRHQRVAHGPGLRTIERGLRRRLERRVLQASVRAPCPC